MITDMKLALMFDLAQEQQKNIQNLIKNAEESKARMESQALSASKIAVQAVSNESIKEVKEGFKHYENNLENLLARAKQANEALENATKNFSYKLIAGFSVFAFACTISLFGVSFWLANTIKEQRQTIARLKAEGGDFQLSTCGGQTCIKVLEEPRYTDGYRIIVRK